MGASGSRSRGTVRVCCERRALAPPKVSRERGEWTWSHDRKIPIREEWQALWEKRTNEFPSIGIYTIYICPFAWISAKSPPCEAASKTLQEPFRPLLRTRSTNPLINPQNSPPIPSNQHLLNILVPILLLSLRPSLGSSSNLIGIRSSSSPNNKVSFRPPDDIAGSLQLTKGYDFAKEVAFVGALLDSVGSLATSTGSVGSVVCGSRSRRGGGVVWVREAGGL